ncbi:MAG: hypothetical protein A3C43_00060 [Candidatus Schekmanbacteria bacterium RIFCSPHIGHO2_02_FULL_38_11]|uniref:FAD-binding PCMH-type domain-containing protein n=1 Tax=Candidatus Schekmanbacteria bacterium RIFCSPLOWO2_12_FULL_38_15 TaxID=1817883 RepID=A0A1F7SEB5_9BACT|nr:MAG: hypothetical protein A2043_07380 [Candidatus Schekmanbacteria bacterium GWA2_38_9]OGL49146.1 MAG: hypothetical protein A3H37_04215 [Candidatus Schekmanbacteria bacterium RIFCSPLOWO2_02_FULL_38_14]OGL52122.1 MAG: hypothetical protein A3G31_06800 [Candidatus Schekmanbacteria bacterium RIFCSPLOWO2_12_FULL_38_15]OGL55579.1 MAG: hypothetical protein A3C43_00060 [Candidatus Schekmanbacteria bacterium RIFCSPHIGHO2_02_FULL_38_11]
MELITKLKNIVGKENASNDASALRFFAEDYSFCPFSMPDYVVKPKDSKEIQAVVKLANEKNIPVIPVSSGVHFYGTTIPSKGGIIVDLRRMDKVLEIDKRNRRTRIEPGVTWGKLQDGLEKEGMTAYNPLLPHREKSALTSLLEREPMLVPKFEYADPILTMEVVLPTGEILRTGSASVPGAPDNALADMVCPYGPGMDFFRLFQGAQGTLGIVTWMNLKIEHFSKTRKVFFLCSSDLGKIKETAYRIQQSMVGNECFILNSLNLSLILSENFPEDFNSLKNKFPEFVLIICLAGSLRKAEEKIAYQEEALGRIASDLSLNLSEALPGHEKGQEIILSMLRKPWMDDVSYWKNRFKGFCNEISFLTTFDKLSMTKDVVFKLSSQLGYDKKDIGIYLQPLEYGRACYCQFHFFYGDKKSFEFKKIKKLDSKIRETLFSEGAHFSNPHGEWGEKLLEKAKPYKETLKKIKNIFDPNGIMNPGRLCF